MKFLRYFTEISGEISRTKDGSVDTQCPQTALVNVYNGRC